jgi:sec-independent protein translocase protein TatB
MSFMGVGPAELLLVLIVALIVFGPERLPKMARDLGKAMGKWRAALDEIQNVTNMPADKVLDLIAKEEEMQESAQTVVEQATDEKADATEEVIHEEKVDATEEVVHEEKVAEEPEVEN